MRRLRRCALWLLVACACLFAAPAFADTDAQVQAKRRFAQGAQAYREARYKEAIDFFSQANRLDPHPDLVFNTGQAYEKLGDAGNALRSYREYLRLAPTATDRATVEASIKNLEVRLRERGVQQVSIFSTPTGAGVLLDDKPAGQTPWTLELAPGRHVVVLRAPGYADTAKAFVLAPEHAMELDIALLVATAAPIAAPIAAPPGERPRPTRLPAARPRAPPPRRAVAPWTIAALGAGVAGLGAALGFELARESAEHAAAGEPVQLAYHADLDTMNTRETVARVFAGVGAALLATGAVLLVIDLRGAGAAPAQVGLGCFGGACGPVLGELLMRSVLGALAASVVLAAACSIVGAGAGCTSGLTAGTPGHDRCDPTGHCLGGYACDAVTNTCVLAGSSTSGGSGTTSHASSSATGGIGTGGMGTGGVGTGGMGTGGMGTGGVGTGGAGAVDAGCVAPFTVCGEACVDLRVDEDHCGDCATPCPGPLSGSSTGSRLCAGSACDVTCAGVTPLDCARPNGNHACVDPETDSQNCGGCGQACPGGQICQGASCVPACGPGLGACGNRCVRLQSDPSNCGGCGKPCNGFAPYCNAGQCVGGFPGCGALTACAVGGDTACVDTAIDPTHCGACGTVCGPSQACAGGVCVAYVVASACWECSGTPLSTCCPVTGAPVVCVSGGACPSP